jgi:hypothetical protein
MASRSPGWLLHESKDFAGFGVAAERSLGKDLATVDFDFEHPTRRLDELYVGLRVRFPNLGRQTGGSGLVVSNDTVFDRHTHNY